MLKTTEVYSQGSSATASVICIHGLGADGDDLVSVVPALKLPEDIRVRFVFPHAPTRPITFNGGAIMPAWYDIHMPGGTFQEDTAGIQESEKHIAQLIEREKQRGIPAHRLFLMGFSQGAAMTLQVGLRHKERLAGLIALSGYLPLHTSLANERSVLNKDVPIFMAHGKLDTVVPYPIGILSREKLAALGYSVSWHDYAMAHQVNDQEINDISAWMQDIL